MERSASDIELVVAAAVDAIADDPEARLERRRAFYERRGRSRRPGNLGRAELAFVEWLVARGVLASPLDPERPGSRWWRGVNRALSLASERAEALHDAGLPAPGDPAVAAWMAFLDDPGAHSFYRAHNTTVFDAALRLRGEALEESAHEQRLIAIVLHRVLLVQALVEQGGLGNRVLTNPRSALVPTLLGLSRLYPTHYPATEADIAGAWVDGELRWDEDSLAQLLTDLNPLVARTEELYPATAEWLGLPDLERFVHDGVPCYPHLTPPAAPPPRRGPRKIAILGGGPSALATAWALTERPDWQDHYDITVYTLGWRLGGKIATGRGPASRIEEHGIHILQGWYHNTFRLLNEVFDERRTEGIDPEAPWQTLEEALVKENATLMTEPDGEGWEAWQLEMPENPFRPGFGPPLSDQQRAFKALKIALVLALGAPHERAGLLNRLLVEPLFRPIPSDRIEPERTPGRTGLRARAKRRLGSLSTTLARRLPRRRHRVLRTVAGLTSRRARRVALARELALGIVRGILADVYDPGTDTLDFERINHLDFREWLRLHQVSEATLDAPLVRFAYTGTFASHSGAAEGQVAAGTALQFGLMALGYKGAFVYKFKAGTGDTILTPWFQVLRNRGVRFEFFHRVEQVHHSDTGRVEEVTVARQVDLRAESYDPLVAVDALKCWPAGPDLDQIEPEQAETLRARGVDLESPWTAWQPRNRRVLTRGRDFDHVVLAIPVAALRSVCREICAVRPDWQAMVDGVRTTCTQSVQLWMRPELGALGFDPAEYDMRAEAEPNLVTYAEPIYSWLDLSSLLPQERWTADRPGTVAYFTGPLPDPSAEPEPTDHDWPSRADAALRARTRAWMDEHIGTFWPRAVREGALDLSLLVADDPGRPAWEQQFFKANIEPTARYTLAWPGSNAVRKRAGESGYDNLWLAGDWTDYGLNIGYIDGAVTSGLQCASALLGHLDLPFDRSRFMGLDRTPRRPASS